MMKAESSTKTIVAILVVVACAVAFWMLLLSPKREEADKLATQSEALQASLAQAQATVAEGEVARREFPENYRQLVVLGEAVPEGEETASLLVQTNQIANDAEVTFQGIELGTPDGSASTETEAAEEVPTSIPAAATATEAEAALLPIGAGVGSAGLGVMPYDLTFDGSFFDVADFIHGIDGLVDAKDEKVAVDGRLVTLDGFSLAVDANEGFPLLTANFSVTTFVVPPDQGVTAGATPTEPAEAAETSETTEGTPSSSTEAK